MVLCGRTIRKLWRGRQKKELLEASFAPELANSHHRRKHIPLVQDHKEAKDADELSGRTPLKQSSDASPAHSTPFQPIADGDEYDEIRHHRMEAPPKTVPQHLLQEIIIEEIEEYPHSTRVRFSNVLIREFPLSIGDSPSCLKGVPISMAMKHSHEQSIDVHEHSSRPRRRHKLAELHISSLDRVRMLKDAGFSGNEIELARKQVHIARYKRVTSTKNLKHRRSIELWESLRRAILNATVRRAAKNRERAFLNQHYYYCNKEMNTTTASSKMTPIILSQKNPRIISGAAQSAVAAAESEEDIDAAIATHPIPSPSRSSPKTFLVATKDSISLSISDHNSSEHLQRRSTTTSFASINMAGEIIESSPFRVHAIEAAINKINYNHRF